MSYLVRRWIELNRQHNYINHWFFKIYGGPDVSEKDFAEQPEGTANMSRILSSRLDGIMAEKKVLEAQMTDEEFEQTLNAAALPKGKRRG